MSDNFIFQQDGAPAHTAAVAQDWMEKKCPGFIGKNKKRKKRKTNGQRIRQISVHWIIMCGAQCWDTIRNARQNRPTLPSWRLPCYRHGVICHRSSLIRQSCHFERDFDRVLLQLVDILNTRFKYREGSWNVWTVDVKVVQSLIRYYWIFRTRLHVYLKRYTLKFKPLYLLNRICYFNEISSVLPESSCLHYLLPDKRDDSVTGRLRHARTFEPVKQRTVKFSNSFIPYCLNHYV